MKSTDLKPRKSHCKRGHEMVENNQSWSIGSSGKPQCKCKICHNIKQRLRYHRLKSQDMK
jgi:hypothetical protein